MADREEQLRKRREYMRQWRIANPERAHENDKRSRSRRDKSKVRAYDKAWKAANPDKAKAYDRKKYLKRRNQIRAKKYGASVTEIDRLMATTACEACSVTMPPGSGCIDHDHDTGAIRGVLCKPCNLALGVALECPERLRGLASYVERVVPQVVSEVGRAILAAEASLA